MAVKEVGRKVRNGEILDRGETAVGMFQVLREQARLSMPLSSPLSNMYVCSIHLGTFPKILYGKFW